MKKRKNWVLYNVDWVIICLYVVIAIFGWANIYATNFNEDSSAFFMKYNYGKQFVWIIFSFLLSTLILLIDSNLIKKMIVPFYIITIILLLVTIFFGSEIKGAKSWINFGFFSLQPSEFAKVSTALLFSSILAGKRSEKMSNKKALLMSSIVVFLPVLIIFLQPDVGSIIIFFALIIPLYRIGLLGKSVLFIILLIILFVLALVFNLKNIFIADTLIILIIYNFLHGKKKTWLISIFLFFTFLLVHLYLDLSEYQLGLGLIIICIFILISFFIKKNNCKRIIISYSSIYILSILFMFTVNHIFNNVLQEHHRTRITVLLGEKSRLKEDIINLKKVCFLEKNIYAKQKLKQKIEAKRRSLKKLKLGIGWNINQSKIAIGSGGFFGKGFLQGTQTKFNFVPEQSTDFIFCTVGEEWGFFGSTILIIFYVALLCRILIISERQRSKETKIYGYCTFSILLFHFAINTAMVLGMAPIIGIPLPFFSYGGSSFISFTLLLFIFIKLDSEKKLILG